MASLPETPLHIANWVAALVFATCAVLQYNDPDPLRWILIYGAAAATSLAYWRLRPRWLAPSIVGAAASIWAATLVPTTLPGLRLGDLVHRMEAKTPAIELGRELLGLVLIAAWMALLVFFQSRGPSDLRSPGSS